ncbi:hypothetical protein K9848_10510 [Latilactobacillus sakei]|nr:hypothetical protein [Latilactobacillus sakei]MCM1635788.1 hypothetical protein [Latilactobacillus sakei]MCP8856592.1 hypothetical protein [Latilactobacillus sakei]
MSSKAKFCNHCGNKIINSKKRSYLIGNNKILILVSIFCFIEVFAIILVMKKSDDRSGKSKQIVTSSNIENLEVKQEQKVIDLFQNSEFIDSGFVKKSENGHIKAQLMRNGDDSSLKFMIAESGLTKPMASFYLAKITIRNRYVYVAYIIDSQSKYDYFGQYKSKNQLMSIGIRRDELISIDDVNNAFNMTPIKSFNII